MKGPRRIAAIRWASRLSRVVAVAGVALVPTLVRAQEAAPGPHEDAAFDFMNLISNNHLHDIHDENWNAYGQFTYISNWAFPFSAPYTNANGSTNSLVPQAERSFAAVFSLFFGVRLWPGAEAYLVPEFVAERPFSDLKGLGASIQDYELQKSGSEVPSLYRAQTFLRQTINLGGKHVEKTSDPMQLAGVVDSRRLVFTLGTFTVLDMFDHSNVNWDPRQTFLNMAFMTHSSWDFAADARGYSYGAAAEFYSGDWVTRVAHMAPPLNPNALPIESNLFQYFADSLEIEHDHVLLGQSGAVRLLGYVNHEYAGRFAEAIAAVEADPRKNAANCPTSTFNYGSGNFTAPDLCWVRRPDTKVGIGVNAEQYITPDVGLFLRAMYSDGRSEVDAYDPADRDLSFGAVARGPLWKRPFDVAGLGFASGWVSDIHAQYLAMGGVDGFIGDGHLKQAPESVAEVFYSFNLLNAIWVTADYQHIWNPGFNADRGPVDVVSGRVHAEF